MKVIIAGGRDFDNYVLLLESVISSNFDITEIVSGGARGADLVGELLASDLEIPLTRFPADWTKYGRAAGPIRNSEMANYADALIAMWDGESSGTKNMIAQATKQGLGVYIARYDRTY